MKMQNVRGARNEQDGLIAESFDPGTRFDMERALDKACAALPGKLNNHDFRRRVAVKLADRVRRGPCSADVLNSAALDEVENLRRRRGR